MTWPADQDDRTQSAAALPVSDGYRRLSTALGLATVVGVFFQIQAPILPDLRISLNAGDLFALLSLTAVVFSLYQNRQCPHWRMPGFNTVLLGWSAVLLVGLFVGLWNHGPTPWALGSKAVGWLVLLGYLSAAYLLVQSRGLHGTRDMVAIGLVVASLVVWLKIWIRVTGSPAEWAAVEPANLEGFTGNRNAFAFQLSVIACAGLALFQPALRRSAPQRRYHAVLLVFGIGSSLLGVLLTGSRTAIGAMLITSVVALLAFRRTSHRLALLGLIGTTLVAWLTLTTLPRPAGLTSVSSQTIYTPKLQSNLSTRESDMGRWAANEAAIQLWQTSPWVGIGLGGFLKQSEERFGYPLVIHSTPIWVLAEFGLIGVIWMVLAVAVGVRFLWVNRPRRSVSLMGTTLLLLMFTMFCQTHEMLYQRIFWLFLGLFLATPWIARSPSATPAQRERVS